MSKRTSTARSRLVDILTEEILASDQPTAFPIASEHELCRRFNISRVTVRLALSDLEYRGLIYRKHGKGTFAHGRNTRAYRNIGLLVKSPPAGEHRPLAELSRGIQTVLAPLQTGLLTISTSPEEWRPEKVRSLGGIVIVPQHVTAKELEIIRDRKLPFLILGESNLSGPLIAMGQREAAAKMTERLLELGHRRLALLSGCDPEMDATKRLGVHNALKAAGIDSASIPEISSHQDEGGILLAAKKLLQLSPRPTAVVAFDDSLAAMLSCEAIHHEGIKVPDEMSIASFHEWPYLDFVEPALTTVRFDFFKAGQRAAEALNQAALTGQPVESLSFAPTFIPGQTIGPVKG